MKIKLGKSHIRWGITIFLVALAVMALYYLMFRSNSVANGMRVVGGAMMAIIYGIIIAYIMAPSLNFIEAKILRPLYLKRGIDVTKPTAVRRRRQMRKISVAMTMAFLLLILYSLLMIIIPQLVNSIRSIVNNLPIYINNIYDLSNKYLSSNPDANTYVNELVSRYSDKINELLNNTLMPNMTELIQTVSKSFISLIRGIFNFLVGLIVAVYLLNSKEVFCGQGKKLAYAFFEENIANEIVSECRFIHNTFIGFLTGKILDSAIIGVLCFIGTSIIGTPYPVLVSVVVGVTNIIPFFGPYIGAIIGSLLVVMIDPIATIYFIIFVLFLQQFDGNILGPKILGNSTGLSSFWVIFAIMFFGGIFGVAGWVIGVPLFAVFYALVTRITNHYLRKKNLPSELYRYIDAAYIENGNFKSLHDKESTKFRTAKPQSAWGKIFKVRSKDKNKKTAAGEKEMGPDKIVEPVKAVQVKPAAPTGTAAETKAAEEKSSERKNEEN